MHLCQDLESFRNVCACMCACGLGATSGSLKNLHTDFHSSCSNSAVFPFPHIHTCICCLLLLLCYFICFGFFVVVILALSLGWDVIVLSTFSFSLFEAASYTPDQVVLTPNSLSTNTFHGLGLQEIAFGTTSFSVCQQDFVYYLCSVMICQECGGASGQLWEAISPTAFVMASQD